MKIGIFRSEIEKIADTKFIRRNSYVYKTLSCWNGWEKIRPVYYSGKGQYVTIHDETCTIKTILDKIGIKYTIGNDAPRGGRYGDFIQVKTKIYF